MKILVSGSRGLLGSALVPALEAAGHTVVRLRRSPAGGFESIPLEGADAVVHLAGENIAGRWNGKKKRRILESRSLGTRTLAEAVARQNRPPRVVVSASAVGYYGDRGTEILREENTIGAGFLAEVCRQSEKAAEPAIKAGVRVVSLRIGVVLSAAGGALSKMLTPFQWGVGGRIGSGEQYMSWIAIDDLTGVLQHALSTDTLRGPVNAVAPNPVTNLQFTKTLGRVLGRPTIFPMPAFAARLAFGEMGEELLLSGQRVEPAKLLATGYRFRFPELEGALRHVLGAVA